MKKIFYLIPIMFLNFSCTAGPKVYELKSPCVAANSDSPWLKMPCLRKPVNFTWLIKELA